MPESTELLSNIALGWLKTLPYPKIICSEGGSILFHNDPATTLFSRIGEDLKSFNAPALLRTYGEGPSQGSDPLHLDAGEHSLDRIAFDEAGTYQFRAVRVSMEEHDHLCFMLVPEFGSGDLHFPQILEAIDCFVTEFAEDGELLYINAKLREALGYPGGSDTELPHLRRFHAFFGNRQFVRDLEAALSGEIVRSQTEFRRADMSHFTVATTLVYLQQGPRASYLLTARDISEESYQHKRLTDALAEANLLGEIIQDENDRLRAQLHRSLPHMVPLLSGENSQDMLKRAEQVAPTMVPVLITGEPGTNKAMIARLVHRLSPRRDQRFVHLDCASLPEEMLESELFGYRRGVFTGSFKHRIGRMKAAHGGTLYLHGIAELPLRLQRNVFSALESKKFTPPGASTEESLDVRIIASSTLILQNQVDDGKFRVDLYEFLRSFPINSIPLRERLNNLPVIINQFIHYFNQKFDRQVKGVDEQAMQRLLEYDYPGNVEELEAMIERAFRTGEGENLLISLPERSRNSGKPLLDVFDGMLTEFLSLDEYQRKYIELVLEATDGKVSGPNGAAEVLKVNPQTLFSKMKRLGIKR